MQMTPAEQEALSKIEADKAAGRDPFGDNDDDTSTDTADNAQASTDAETAVEAQSKNTEAATATTSQDADGKPAEPRTEAIDKDALNEITNPAADPLNILNFTAEVPQDYKTQRQTLMKEKAEAMGKLMDGEMDASEYAAIETRVADALEELTAARIRAETLQEATIQSQARYQQQQISNIAQQAKKSGELDYMADKTAQAQFDIALQGLKAIPENANKDFSELAKDAHNAVLAMRGIAKKSATSTEASNAQPPERKPDGQPPVTLRNLPNAAQSNTGGNVIDGLARLKGEEYESAFAKLTPAQKRALLDD